MREAGWSRSVLQIEDFTLFAWFLVAQPLFLSKESRGLDELSSGGPLKGWLFLIASGLAVVALGTRNVGDAAFSPDANSPRSIAPLPFMAGLALVAGFGIESLGWAPAGVAFLPAFAATIAAFVFYPRLPALPLSTRRALMMPLILACATVFSATMVGLFDALSASQAFEAGLGLAIFVALFSGGFYAMFVFAPRQMVAAEGSMRDWLVRYGFFIATSLAGVTAIRVMGR